jgi:hypothetical protein
MYYLESSTKIYLIADFLSRALSLTCGRPWSEEIHLDCHMTDIASLARVLAPRCFHLNPPRFSGPTPFIRCLHPRCPAGLPWLSNLPPGITCAVSGSCLRRYLNVTLKLGEDENAKNRVTLTFCAFHLCFLPSLCMTRRKTSFLRGKR